MLDLIALSQVPALLATFLQERRSRKEAITAETIANFQEWLCRSRHDQVISALASHENILHDLGKQLEYIAVRSETATTEIRSTIVESVRGLRGFGWLSKTMPTARIDSSLPLIGRDHDLAALEARRDEDSVLVGQPGSGKTFLLEYFAANTDAEFVIPSGVGLLREELGLARPSTVILDDCGDKREIITDLIDLRERDTEATYRIIAVCWPSEKDIVAQWLRRSPASVVLEMQPLPRDAMVEVVKATGIHGPNSIIRMIVDQSMNKPGLAVTLSKIALNHGVPDLWRGDAIYTAVRDWFERRIGKQATAILAAFAIGGQQGMNRTVVERWSGIAPAELGPMLKELATGGMLHEGENQNLSVEPEVLRHALIKDQFFD